MAKTYGIKIQMISSELKFTYGSVEERDEALRTLDQAHTVGQRITVGEMRLVAAYIVHYSPYEADRR